VLEVCFLNVFWHIDHLYGPWFVFITECEGDNTDMEGLFLLNVDVYQAFLHIDQWNGVYIL